MQREATDPPVKVTAWRCWRDRSPRRGCAAWNRLFANSGSSN
jgi:hypothetical protein